MVALAASWTRACAAPVVETGVVAVAPVARKDGEANAIAVFEGVRCQNLDLLLRLYCLCHNGNLL